MIYRNGAREYLRCMLLFGGIMGVFFGLMYLSVFMGVIGGVFSGALFTLFIFLFTKFMERKYDKKRIEIAKERKIICDGGATIAGNGGWLFFTEKALEFYPHKINVNTSEFFIDLNDIRKVGAKGNKIIIETIENGKVPVVVSSAEKWRKTICGVIKSE